MALRWSGALVSPQEKTIAADELREAMQAATTRVYPECPDPVEMRPDFYTIF